MDLCLKERFRGTLLGVLVGNCFGSDWEDLSPGRSTLDIGVVRRKIELGVENSLRDEKQCIPYASDSVMTFSVAGSLLSCKGYDAKDMSNRFVDDYFKEPDRGYGRTIPTVFTKLKSGVEDIYEPAAEQFNGRGSYGNGSAMRVASVALFAYKKKDTLIEVARNSAKITHAHSSAIIGAILQAIAVHAALELRGSDLEPVSFVESLLSVVIPLEKVVKEPTPNGAPGVNSAMDSPLRTKRPSVLPSYQSKLLQIKEFIKQPHPPSADEITQTLGNGIKACEAVPCAIYAFLHCHKLSFKYLIPYAISLGGDTDTIASMAGAIGGAYWGESRIPMEWVNSVEGSNQAIKLADGLFELYNCNIM